MHTVPDPSYGGQEMNQNSQSSQRPVRDPRGMVARVYEHVRDQIVNGSLTAGSQVVQEQLAEDLGVSRTPVREALNRLAQEDLVETVPGSGFVISALLDEEIDDVFEVRRSLEITAAGLAWGKHTRVDFAMLEDLSEQMADSNPTDDAVQFDLNRRFHRTLSAACGNRILLRMLDSLWDHPVNRRITRAYLRGGANTMEMVREHRELLQTLHTGTKEQFVERVEQHLSEGYLEARNRR